MSWGFVVKCSVLLLTLCIAQEDACGLAVALAPCLAQVVCTKGQLAHTALRCLLGTGEPWDNHRLEKVCVSYRLADSISICVHLWTSGIEPEPNGLKKKQQSDVRRCLEAYSAIVTGYCSLTTAFIFLLQLSWWKNSEHLVLGKALLCRNAHTWPSL